jgi:hypothetical protein
VTVYVDDMRASFRRMIMCHMIADTPAELHAMADRIGVARRWYQGDHYDIALAKRKLAIEHGAVEVTQRQLAAMAYLRRIGAAPRSLGDPATAIQRMLDHKGPPRAARGGAHG